MLCAAGAIVAISATPGLAQGQSIAELKTKISEAHAAQTTFANGLRFCKELDGKHFYLAPRNRVLGLDEYHRAIENLAREKAFNAETHRPWDEAEANTRWEQAKLEAVKDKASCELVANLPAYEKRLQELEKASAAKQ